MAKGSTSGGGRTIAQLLTAIRKLPSDPPMERPGIWYTTQKQHWLGWLREDNGPGAYGRTNCRRDAKFVYNHIVNPYMLLWLMDAAGLSRTLVRKASRAAAAASRSSLQTQARAVRRHVPWPVVEQALWR